jgi:TRAP-type uncharacterized transport system substrate-binding protein
MYRNCVGTLLFVAFIALFRIDVASAQAIPKSLQQGGSDAAIRERKNAWTVGIAGGLIDGTYMRFADELGKVLDDGDNLRILPMVSYGAASNLDDLLYLRGVDLAVTQSDVFEYFRTERKTPNLQNRVHYMLRLPIAELHILAKTDIRSVEDLRGKRVNFGPAGSGSSLTGTIVFQRLGVQVEQVLIDQQSALQRLQSGDVAALVRVVGKPVDFFTKIPPNSGLHVRKIVERLRQTRSKTAGPIGAELAKTCRALAIKAHPTQRAGSKTGSAQVQRDYFQECVANRSQKLAQPS